MNIFDRYIFKNLAIATLFVSLTLVVVIFLSQSLRFLELVMDSGASGLSFWILTLLALPRFFEIILPLALMAGVLFVYNRMSSDSELAVVRSLGASPLSLSRPALILALVVTVFLWGMTMWAAPKSLSQMHHMRQIIKAQFSAFFLKEGVFNSLGDGLTVYVRERAGNDELKGILIHDARAEDEQPSTIMAKRGVVLGGEDGYEVVVYDGSRQQFDPESKILQRLKFERYLIELPESGPVRKRWKEPDERTIFELLNPSSMNVRDQEPKNQRLFQIELHRRITGPLLTMVFTALACAAMVLGPTSRRGQAKRIVAVILAVVLLESLFLSSANVARKSDFGYILMYGVTLLPFAGAVFFLLPASENVRRQILYHSRLFSHIVKRRQEVSS